MPRRMYLFLRIALAALMLLAAIFTQPFTTQAYCPGGTYCNNILYFRVSCRPDTCTYDPDITICQDTYYTCRDTETGPLYGSTAFDCNNYCIEDAW
jgi:hypothetical protein